jgi:Protein of unknown function (DUF2384)
MSAILKSATAANDQGLVLTKAVMRAAERLNVPANQLSAVIGLSEASLSRMKNGRYFLEQGSKPFEIALLFVRLFRSLDAIVGGDDNVAAAWLQSSNTALNGIPAQKIRSVAGLVDVLSYLDARRALV